MSTVYVLEPPTKGKVVVTTTHGPIDIELWPKEAPKAVRNFVQLCLEGYFDNTIFHRVIPGFLVQGGDPTGSGTGGESIYGDAFLDEFHSRLRFNHRGIVAMANAGSLHSNGSQFFMTLDKCDWLDKKHTIFGKVTGDSIFNLLRLGEVDTDKDDRPLDPVPRILSVEVLWNPFEDIVPRMSAKAADESLATTETKEPRKKGIKKLSLLSFGEEAEEEEKELAAVRQKIKSSHDVLNDPRLLKSETADKEPNAAVIKEALSVREALSSKKEGTQKDKSFAVSGSIGDSEEDDDDGDEAKFDAKMRRQVLNRRKEMGDMPSKPIQKKGNSSPKGREKSIPRSDDASSDDDKPKVEKLSLRKKGLGSEVRSERIAKADTDLQLYNDSERARLLQKLKRRRLQGREDDVLAKLEKFKQTISTNPEQTEGESEEAKENLSDWQKVKLKFAPERGKDHMSRKDDPDAYMVVDPLLEKGKEKFNKMQAKQKRREREWAGRSLT
ncbi:PREDICTED: peptidyl-prolyl cis-trans isomerase CYP57 [Tarenaya hassleriana]|uniref:peptidyl-prolyl cis-trans isomerase CYP57 n=1 Tax=Tarenaya hassleriana TaxID=28532 RepID=UPI00053C54C3|nr:PREDICTED: peptidyl-prolyl cis-trans isomerase CYP57 [Tarenaya hassleriana]